MLPFHFFGRQKFGNTVFCFLRTFQYWLLPINPVANHYPPSITFLLVNNVGSHQHWCPILLQLKNYLWGKEHKYTCSAHPCQTSARAEWRIMVSSNDDTGTLPFHELITLPCWSSRFILDPPSPAKDPSDKDEVPSSIPLWPSHDDNVVASSIPHKHHPESNVDDKEDKSYTHTTKDINNFLKATERKKMRAAKSSAKLTALKSVSSKQQPDSDDDVDDD